MKINEIFRSIQGESSYAGLPFIFVRFTGCNLRCIYCDTTYAYEEGFEISEEKLLDRIKSHGIKSVEITGGEPLLQEEVYRLTDNLILVEIKTPTTKLLSKEYRDNIYSVSTDLSGAINQILNYKDCFQKEYNQLTSNTSPTSELFNPKCLLIVGNQKKEIINKNLRRSFELYRSEMKSVEIITFDELFEKIKFIVNMFQ